MRYLWLFALGLCSCGGQEEITRPLDPGYDYFPTNVGTWVEYEVDSIWRDDGFQVYDSISYRLRQVIADHYVDPGGREALRIERFIWRNDQWVIRDVWSGVHSKNGLEIQEENQRKLKLSFPVREGRSWDMNIFTPLAELMVAARDVDEPYSSGDMLYAQTVRVENTVPANFVIRRDIRERYAYGVGMVEHESHSDTIQNGLHRSRLYRMRAIGYGME